YDDKLIKIHLDRKFPIEMDHDNIWRYSITNAKNRRTLFHMVKHEDVQVVHTISKQTILSTVSTIKNECIQLMNYYSKDVDYVLIDLLDERYDCLIDGEKYITLSEKLQRENEDSRCMYINEYNERWREVCVEYIN